MSTAAQSIPLQLSNYHSNTQLVVCVNPLTVPRQDTPPTPLTTLQNVPVFHSESPSAADYSQVLLHRLYHQRSRVLGLYDSELECRQYTRRLIEFLDGIDQLLEEYDRHPSATPANTGNINGVLSQRTSAHIHR